MVFSVPMEGPGEIAAGWECLRVGEWARARELFEASLARGETAAAFEGLAWACFWLADAERLLDARVRAYRLHLAGGDLRGAARAAMWLASEQIEFRGNVAVANGWFRRARRLLADVDPSPEHGWLALHEGEGLLFGRNDAARARELAADAGSLGRRFDSPELEAVALALEGLCLVTEGRVPEGMALLDEAAAAALAGDFRELWAIAWASCYLIYACERVQDLDRADAWCREVEEVTARMGIDFAWAVCRAHHAGVLLWRGEWREAEAELHEAERELGRQRPPWMAEATVRLGELRRRQRRLAEAEELFRRAEGHPLAAVGMAELALDRGEPARARRLAERMLRAVPRGALTERASGLQLVARAAAALGDVGAAGAALAELEGVAGVIGTLPLRASAAACAGALHAARGEPDLARRRFEDAIDLFQRARAPYEGARTRLQLADALAVLGAAREAEEERGRAAEVLLRLGLEGETAGRAATAAPARPLTPREREVLALVARGLSDRRMAEALVLSEHTVHRHVANILTKLGCPSRAAAAARGVALGLIEPLRE